MGFNWIVFGSTCGGVLLVGGLLVVLWCRGLAWHTRTPLLVYLLSYLITYCIGAVLLFVTKGDILSVYWAAPVRVPYSVIGTPVYWAVLVLPLILVPLTVRLFAPAANAPRLTSSQSRLETIGVWWPLVLFLVAAAVLLRNPTYASGWSQPFAYFSQDAREMYSTRADRLGAIDTTDAAILYNIMPFLTFVTLLEALERRRWREWAVTGAMIVATGLGQLVLAQAAPTLIFGIGIFVAILAYGNVRHRATVGLGVGALLGALWFSYLLFKFGRDDDPRLVLEHVLRMPCVYPLYLAYVETRGHPGIQIVSLLTAGRLEPRTPWALVVSNFGFGGWGDGFMPAPANVIAYADSGLLYECLVLVLIGVGIVLCARLFKAGRSTLSMAFGMSCCGAIYMTTQASVEASVYQAWGVGYTLVPLLLLRMASSVSLGRPGGSLQVATAASSATGSPTQRGGAPG